MESVVALCATGKNHGQINGPYIGPHRLQSTKLKYETTEKRSGENRNH